MRDPHKYDWLPHDPPRLPRAERMSLSRTALTLLVAWVVCGLIAWGALLWNTLWHFLGWLWVAS